jgi:hypothetical protein
LIAHAYHIVLPISLHHQHHLPHMWPNPVDACACILFKSLSVLLSIPTTGPGPNDCGGQYHDTWIKSAGPPPHCIIGNVGQIRTDDSVKHWLSNWTSQVRDTSVGPSADTPEAQPGYDDNQWKVRTHDPVCTILCDPVCA